jgi:hypothetical protein
MHYLWIQCGCGADSDQPAPAGVMSMSRDEILARARCKRCRAKNAVQMRRYWNPRANALDGARQIGEGLAEW